MVQAKENYDVIEKCKLLFQDLEVLISPPSQKQDLVVRISPPREKHDLEFWISTPRLNKI